MSESPLIPDHEAANASFTELDGFRIPLHYGDPESEIQSAASNAGLMDLAHVGTAVLEGPDARRFSNGMFTNNIRDLAVGECNRSAMCDDRGRVQGLIDVHCTDDDRFEIVLEGVTGEWFEERYGLYIVFDDVELSVSNEGPWVLTIQGPDSTAVVAKAGFPTPQTGLHITSDEGIRVASKDRTGLGGYDLIVPTDAIHSVWERLLAAGANRIGHQAMEHLRIRAGRARWPIDGTEKTLVHELRINEEVCNFNKGCYLGQEVINRVDVKGQVAKRLERLVLPKGTGSIGANVQLEDKAVGTISSITHGATKTIGLAVIRKSAWEATEVTVETDSGPVTAAIERI